MDPPRADGKVDRGIRIHLNLLECSCAEKQGVDSTCNTHNSLSPARDLIVIELVADPVVDGASFTGECGRSVRIRGFVSLAVGSTVRFRPSRSRREQDDIAMRLGCLGAFPEQNADEYRGRQQPDDPRHVSFRGCISEYAYRKTHNH